MQGTLTADLIYEDQRKKTSWWWWLIYFCLAGYEHRECHWPKQSWQVQCIVNWPTFERFDRANGSSKSRIPHRSMASNFCQLRGHRKRGRGLHVQRIAKFGYIPVPAADDIDVWHIASHAANALLTLNLNHDLRRFFTIQMDQNLD